MMRLGIHVRTGGGLEEAVTTAAQMGCETIQIFASNPSAWRSGSIPSSKAEIFQRLVLENNLHPVVIHTPYLLNMASPDAEIYAKSSTALADSMSRAAILKATYVVTHIGSHRGEGLMNGIARICESVSGVLDQANGSAELLLENSAGGGDGIGSKFEELQEILDHLSRYEGRLGICLDTAHMYGAGYDISSPEKVYTMVEKFDEIVGLKWLKLWHLNDTKVDLASRKDRHAHIGTGNIGEEAFAALINHPAMDSLAGIIETPQPTPRDEEDVDVLKRLRG